MRPLVAEVAVAVRSLPVPVVVEPASGQLRIGVLSRSAPQIEVDFRRDLVVAECSDRLSTFVAQAASKLDITDSAAVQEGESFVQRLARSALSSDLADAFVFASGGDQCGTFRDVMADGLFNVRVLAGLHRPHAAQSVPVVGSRRADRIN